MHSLLWLRILSKALIILVAVFTMAQTNLSKLTSMEVFQITPLLYRHAAELYIKSIIWNGDEILEFLKQPTSGAKGEDKSTHSLMKLLPYAEYVINAFKLKWDQTEFGPYADAVELIKEIDDFDPTSFKFRYPIDKKGKPSEHHEFGFNLFAFAEPVTKVLEGWWDLATGVESVREYHTLA